MFHDILNNYNLYQIILSNLISINSVKFVFPFIYSLKIAYLLTIYIYCISDKTAIEMCCWYNSLHYLSR